MSDCIRITEGQHPWAPAGDATPGLVLDRYNVPRAGLLHQNGLTYYFECILGDGDGVGLWAYVLVSEEEVKALLDATEPAAIDEFSERLLRDRVVTLGATSDDYHLTYFTNVDAGDQGRSGLTAQLMANWKRNIEANAGLQRLVPA